MAEAINTEKIKVCRAFLDITENNRKVTASKLRGFMGYFFLEDTEFHHHGENSSIQTHRWEALDSWIK